MTGRLLEDESLSFIQRFGVAVPNWSVIDRADSIRFLPWQSDGKFVIKALLPVGGRQKSGVVCFANSEKEAMEAAERLLGNMVKGFKIERLLVSEFLDISQELFLSITFDSRAGAPVVLFSQAGGIEIELSLSYDPSLLQRHIVDVLKGLSLDDARQIVEQSISDAVLVDKVASAIVGSYNAFWAGDASVIEINPLVVTSDGEVVAASAVVQPDLQASFRLRKDMVSSAPPHNGQRPLTALELEMLAIDDDDPTAGKIRFNEFEDGDIGLMVTGGGAGLLALDTMQRCGGKAATSFDIKTGRIEEKMYRATRAVLKRPGLKGLVVGANYSNFSGIDVKARGVIRAVVDEGIDCQAFPVVIRLCGPNQEVAEKLAAEVPGLIYLDEQFTIEDTVKVLMERVAGSK